MIYGVMGVCACGKTTIGSLLGNALQLPFFDADDFHSEANRYKMSVLKQPLNDTDRQPWLEACSPCWRPRSRWDPDA